MMRITLLIRRIYAMRTYEPETLLRQHISNIEPSIRKQYSTATL